MTKVIRVAVTGAKTKSASRTSRASTVSSSVRTAGKRRATPLLAIDPGLSGTGLAWFDGRGWLEHWRVLTTEKKNEHLDWWSRALLLANEVARLTSMEWAWRLDKRIQVVSEFPMKMESAAGIAAQKHSTARLAFLVGAVGAALTLEVDCDFSVVTPQEWKGQLPKSIVRDRIIQRLGKGQVAGVKTHAWDAIGIGLWRLGKL